MTSTPPTRCTPDYNLEDMKEKIRSVVTNKAVLERVEASTTIIGAWAALHADINTIFQALPLIQDTMIWFAVQKDCVFYPKGLHPFRAYFMPESIFPPALCTTCLCQHQEG